MSTTDLARKALLAVLAVVFLTAAGRSFYQHRHLREPVVLGPGVTRVTTLAEYNETIALAGKNNSGCTSTARSLSR